MDKNIPVTPQTISPNTTPSTVIRGFILTLDPTITGSNILLSTRCVMTSVVNTSSNFPAAAAVAKVISRLIAAAKKIPT